MKRTFECSLLNDKIPDDILSIHNMSKKIRFGIYSFMSLGDLSSLSFTCHYFIIDMLDYCTLWQVRRIFNIDIDFVIPLKLSKFEQTCINLYKQLGVFMKKVTCLLPTNERLKFIGYQLNKLQGPHVSICDKIGCDVAYRCYGSMLNIFVKGWEDSEKYSAFNFIKSSSCFDSRLKSLLYKDNYDFNNSLYIHVFFNEIFLNCCNYTEKCVWISFLIRKMIVTFQVECLLVICNPMNFEFDWNYLGINVHSPTFDWYNVGKILKTFDKKSFIGYKLDSLKIYLAMIEYPTNWSIVNQINLLLECGKKFISKIILHYIHEGNFNKASLILYKIYTFLGWNQYEMNSSYIYFVKILKHICNSLISNNLGELLFDGKFQLWTHDILDEFDSDIF